MMKKHEIKFMVGKLSTLISSTHLLKKQFLQDLSENINSNILPNYDIEYNFLNFDIQGAELKALKGMENYLSQVDYLYSEVNSDYVYKDCVLINELDDYLNKFGLIRVETYWTPCKWGDAFYIKKILLR